MAPRLVDDVDDDRVRFLALLDDFAAHQSALGDCESMLAILVQRSQASAGNLGVERRRLGRPGVDDHLDRRHVEALEIEAAVDQNVDAVAAKAGDDLFTFGLRRFAAREGCAYAGLEEVLSDVARVLDRRSEDQRLLSGRQRLYAATTLRLRSSVLTASASWPMTKSPPREATSSRLVSVATAYDRTGTR